METVETNEEQKSSIVNVDEITYREISDPAVMAKEPLVSVKMLTYNHEPYIAQAIEGVLMQECDFDIELIIGEDCSPDNTREIVMKYQQMRPDIIRVVAWDKNTGGRRNSRVVDSLMRGKYIAWCEGDDYWIHPKKLQMQVDVMENDTEVGLVFTGADIESAETNKLVRWNKSKNNNINDEIFTKILLNEISIQTASVCIKEELYRTIMRTSKELNDPKLRIGSIPMWLELSLITSFKLINESMVIYRLLPESACHFKDIGKTIDHIKYRYDMKIRYAERLNCKEEVIRRIHDSNSRNLLFLAYISGDNELINISAKKLKDLGLGIRMVDKLVLYASNHKLFRIAFDTGIYIRRVFFKTIINNLNILSYIV